MAIAPVFSPMIGLLLVACAALGDEVPLPPGVAASAARSEVEALETLHAAATAISAGEPHAALARLDPFVAARPDDAVARFLRGVALVALERFADARAELEAAVALEPGDPAYLSVLARCRHELGDLDGAIAALEETLAIAPDHPRTRTNLGHLYLAAERVADAAAVLVAAAEADPRDVDAHLGLGEIFLMVGDPARAEAAFRTAAGIDGGEPTTVLQLGRAIVAQGRAQDATEVLRAGVAAHPRHALLRAALATALGDAGRLAEARETFREALALPASEAARPSILMRHGVLLERMGEADEAIDELELALAGDPGLRRAHEVLGLLHLDRDEPTAALEHLVAALDHPLVRPETVFHAARLAERLGDEALARHCAGMLFAADPQDPEIAFRVAQLRLRSTLPDVHDVLRARALLVELVGRPDGGSAASWDLLSEACAASGDWQGALEAIEHALRLGDDGAVARQAREGRRADYRARIATR